MRFSSDEEKEEEYRDKFGVLLGGRFAGNWRGQTAEVRRRHIR